MKHLGKTAWCLSVALLLCYSPESSARGMGGDWKSFSVTYKMDPDYKKGPSMNWKGRKVQLFDERTSKIYIPADLKKGETIRGAMPRIRGLGEFANKNRVAMYDGNANAPYGCVNSTFLKAAAKVTGHPELEHAGVILQGLSNGGRFAAHAAHYWPKKVLAVILDHSWAGGPSYQIGGYSYGQLPVSEGTPYFFNASQKDMFQGGNRRAFHYKWCTSAFRGPAKQPCTSVISYEDVGHGNCGTRSLQAIWLEEVLALRVPVYIDPNGAPYELKPINVDMVGGHVIAKLDNFEGRSIHNDVQVGPIGFSRKGVSWWIPGPRSAKEMLVWLKKNDGKVALDYSSYIKSPVLFESSDKKLIPVCRSLSTGKLGTASKSIESMLAKCSPDKAEDKARIAELTFYKQLVDEKVAEHLEMLEKVKATGDLQHLSELLKKNRTQYTGVPAYDEASKAHSAMLRQSDSMVNLRVGRSFYSMIKQIQRLPRPYHVKSLKKFADKNPDWIYGKMAARVGEDLQKDLKANIDLDRYRFQ